MRASFDYGVIPCSITIAGRDARQIHMAEDVTRSTALRVMRALDPDDPKSDLSKLNNIAATARWPVPQDTFRALDLALHYGRTLDGAYDPTMTPLARMWGLGSSTPPAEAPIPELLDAARNGVGMDKIALGEDGTIAFLSPLTRIDLGPLAPAYALDITMVNVRRRSITNALLQFGSSTRCLGMRDRKTLWSARVADPMDDGALLGQWTFRHGGALCQSRIYAPDLRIGTNRFSGIIDPRTGIPVSNTLTAVVSGPTATLSATLAHALMVVGLEQGTNLLARFPRYEAMLVTASDPSTVHATEGFSRSFTLQSERGLSVKEWVRAEVKEEEQDAEDQSEPAKEEPTAESSS